MLAKIKRRLRENPLTCSTYDALARSAPGLRAKLYHATGRRLYSSAYFDRLFEEHADPWCYEQLPLASARRELLLTILPRARYARMLEIGCAEGWMTAGLARRTDDLRAIDISGVALQRARARVGSANNISFDRLDLVTEAIGHGYHAIICAGVLVYLLRAEQRGVRDKIVQALAPGGDLVLEHERHTGPSGISGREVHDSFARNSALCRLEHVERDTYAITLLRKRLQ